MSDKKLIDDAIEAFNLDESNWFEISNLIFEDLNNESKQYLFDEAEQICNSKIMPYEFKDILRWAISQKLTIDKDAIDKFATLVLNSEFSTDTFLACEIAEMYRKETYEDGFGEPFHDPEKAKEWILISFNSATSADDFIRIIESVSDKHTGLRIGDKSWGLDLLGQVKSKADDKTFKKVEKAFKSTLS
jgi:hypothetical protein